MITIIILSLLYQIPGKKQVGLLHMFLRSLPPDTHANTQFSLLPVIEAFAPVASSPHMLAGIK